MLLLLLLSIHACIFRRQILQAWPNWLCRLELQLLSILLCQCMLVCIACSVPTLSAKKQRARECLSCNSWTPKAHTCLVQADDTIQMIIYDNEYQQGASRGTVNAMAADTTQNWTVTFLNGDVSYAR